MTSRLDELFSQFPTRVRLAFGRTDGWSEDAPAERTVAVLEFSEQGFGFGEITIVQTKKGCFVDTEHMSKDRVKRYLCALIDGAILDTDTDAERHLLYNEEAGRRCGEGCAICYPSPKVLP